MKNIDIGKLIRRIADEQHWQLSDLAKALNCSRSSLYHIFNSRDITLDRLIRISRVFNYNLLDEILREIEPCSSPRKACPVSPPYLAIPFVDSEIDISDIPVPILRALRSKIDEACNKASATEPDVSQIGQIRPENGTLQ